MQKKKKNKNKTNNLLSIDRGVGWLIIRTFRVIDLISRFVCH